MERTDGGRETSVGSPGGSQGGSDEGNSGVMNNSGPKCLSERIVRPSFCACECSIKLSL